MSTYNKKIYIKLVDYIKTNQDDFYRLAFSYVKNKEAALDIVQESLYKALKSVEKLKNSAYMKTWLYRIIVNTSLSYIRKNQKIILMDEVREVIEPEKSEVADRMDLYSAIDKLDDKYRTVIILRYLEDIKIGEIAKITDSNINTVKSRIKSAIQKLRTILEGEGYSGSKI